MRLSTSAWMLSRVKSLGTASLTASSARRQPRPWALQPVLSYKNGCWEALEDENYKSTFQR